MIAESILVVFFALVLDFVVGDPRNKFHPTAWIGSLIAKLTPHTKHSSEILEKLGGIFIILISSGIVLSLLIFLNIGIKLITIDYYSSFNNIKKAKGFVGVHLKLNQNMDMIYNTNTVNKKMAFFRSKSC